MEQLLKVDFGDPLHCFIIPGEMHPLEKECFDLFLINKLENSSLS